MKHVLFFILLLVSALPAVAATSAEAPSGNATLTQTPENAAPPCLDGFDLTAIVVMETDIRQSVAALHCQMAFAERLDSYWQYRQLRDKWQQQRKQQKQKRDDVYRRIYGDSWQEKLQDWTISISKDAGSTFVADWVSCQELKRDLIAHTESWDFVYNTAAAEAAQEKYDPLRCEPVGTIRIQMQTE